MKKVLLCTSALAATSFTGTANAVEVATGPVNLDIGGFFTTTLGASSIDTGSALAGTDFDGVDVFTNSEIIFRPSITLDNGITIGAEIQLEGDTSGDQIDESYFFAKGNFGELKIGSENSAGYTLTVAAPDVSHIFAQSSSLTGFIPYSGSIIDVNGDGIEQAGDSFQGSGLFRGTLGTTYIENDGNNDASRITYITPNFGGFVLGISYANDITQGNGPVDTNNAANGISDIVDIGANYGGSFGGLDINASARYGIASSVGPGDPEIWGAGLNLGYAGFTFGGSYAEQDGTATSDGRAYDVGIGYTSGGPWSYSLTYFNGENIDNDALTLAAAPGSKEQLETVILAARYTYNANFSVGAFIANTDFTEEFSANGIGADDVEGTVLGLSASFSF